MMFPFPHNMSLLYIIVGLAALPYAFITVVTIAALVFGVLAILGEILCDAIRSLFFKHDDTRAD